MQYIIVVYHCPRSLITITAIDGCRATEITSKYTDIYLFPQKDMFNDLEVAVATCTRGYLESKTCKYIIVVSSL